MELFYAAWGGRPEAVTRLLAVPKVNLEFVQMGRTPLLAAAEEGHLACARLLLQAGASKEARTVPHGWSPLMMAARKQHTAIVQLLLDADADLDAKDDEGRTAYDVAWMNGHSTMCKMLEGTVSAKFTGRRLGGEPDSAPPPSSPKSPDEQLVTLPVDIPPSPCSPMPERLYMVPDGLKKKLPPFAQPILEPGPVLGETWTPLSQRSIV